MKERHPAQIIIDDLKELRQLSEKFQDGNLPEVAIRYLLLNYYPIEFCVNSVYERLTKAQRDELRNNHRELDYSVSADDARPIVLDALTSLKHYYAEMGDLKKDDLTMLIRALEYAKYLDIAIPFLFRSP